MLLRMRIQACGRRRTGWWDALVLAGVVGVLGLFATPRHVTAQVDEGEDTEPVVLCSINTQSNQATIAGFSPKVPLAPSMQVYFAKAPGGEPIGPPRPGTVAQLQATLPWVVEIEEGPYVQGAKALFSIKTVTHLDHVTGDRQRAELRQRYQRECSG